MSVSLIVATLLMFALWIWGMAERHFRHEAEATRDYLRGQRDKWRDERNRSRDEREELEERYNRLQRAWRRTARAYLALQYATIEARDAVRAPATGGTP